jgi:hypothetical protein
MVLGDILQETHPARQGAQSVRAFSIHISLSPTCERIREYGTVAQ